MSKWQWVRGPDGRAHLLRRFDGIEVMTWCDATFGVGMRDFIKEPKQRQPWCVTCTDKEREVR